MPRIQRITGRTRQVQCPQVRGGKWTSEPTTVSDGVEILIETLANRLPADETEIKAAIRACRGLPYVEVPEGIRGKLEAEVARLPGQRTQNERDFTDQIKGARAAAAVTRG